MFFSSKQEFDGENFQITQNLYDTHVCFDNIFLPRLECASSFNGHRMEHILYFPSDKVDVKFTESFLSC